jgi:hypothetical protein
VFTFSASTTPLQGFFNFVVFMAPKVRTTRTLAMRGARTDSSNNNNQNQHLTWRQAFYKAYMDRGRRVKDRNMRNNNRAEGRKIRAAGRKISETFRTIFERTQSFTRSTITRTSTEVADLESGVRSAAASQ